MTASSSDKTTRTTATLHTPSTLGGRICNILLVSLDNKKPIDFTCVVTGESVRGRCNYHVIKNINPHATGSYFIALGYYYILCLYPKTMRKYVAVHAVATGGLVCWTKDGRRMSVPKRRSKS